MLKIDRIENGFLDRYPDRIITVDSHTQGEPTRLLIGGVGQTARQHNERQTRLFRISLRSRPHAADP